MPAEFWASMKDLIVLVADKNMDFLLRGLLLRLQRVENIRDFTYDQFIHPERDPGVYNDASKFLGIYSVDYSYALVILDRIGSGREKKSREVIEEDIESRLSRSGWNDRACAIAIDPELENWVWVNETWVKRSVAWEQEMGVYDWLHKNNWKTIEKSKPDNPKEAFEAVLKHCRTPRSSSIYHEISTNASYQQCKDPAFQKMLNQLKVWFEVAL